MAKNAFNGHKDWPKMWRSPEPREFYDAIIIGGGGHGLGTAYYLAIKLSSVICQKSLCLFIKLLNQVYSSCVVRQKFAKASHLSPILCLHFSAAEFTSNNVP